jgi:hypothetical protein
MRKKQWIICATLVALIFAFVIYNVFAVVSPEFETSKKLALTATPDSDGDCIIGKKITENGVQVVYLVGYLFRVKTIAGCVATPEKMVSVAYNETDGVYSTSITDMQTGRILVSREISQEQASKIMGIILKHLVNSGIPI